MNSQSVLVVDDDAGIRDALRDVLEDEGCTVYTAANGLEALRVLAALPERPGLLLLDLMMPVMSGWEVLDRLREDGTLDALDVMVMTASQTDQVAGARVVRKPLDLDTVLAIAQGAQVGSSFVASPREPRSIVASAT